MPVMTVDDIQARLTQELAVILSVEPSILKPDLPLHTLGVDSMSFVELLVFIEKAFNLRLIESGLTREDFKTLHALAQCIGAKQAPIS